MEMFPQLSSLMQDHRTACKVMLPRHCPFVSILISALMPVPVLLMMGGSKIVQKNHQADTVKKNIERYQT